MSDQQDRPPNLRKGSGQDAGGASWPVPDDWDQLISDALDDRLGEQDRSRLERLVEEHPEAAEHWQLCLKDQSRLREHLSLFASGKERGSGSLPDDFSKRVLRDARARAGAGDGLHPLVTAGTGRAPAERAVRPSQHDVLERPRRRSQALLFAAAVAASLLLLVGPAVWRFAAPGPGPVADREVVGSQGADPDQGNADQGNAGEGVGDNDPLPADSNPVVVDLSGTSQESDDSDTLLPGGVVDGASGQQSVADRQRGEDDTDPTMNGEGPDISAVAGGSHPRPESDSNGEVGRTGELDATADVVPDGAADLSDAMVAADPMAGLTGAVLVYEVQLTRRGRSEQAVRRAMAQAGLEPASEQTVNAELAGVARRVSEPPNQGDTDDFQILYLQASARKLDALFSQLNDDRDGVAAIGMTLATDAPIKKLTTGLEQVDPTRVKGAPVSWALTGEQPGTLGELRRSLGQRTFIPMRADGSTGGLATQGSQVSPSGPGSSAGASPGGSVGEDVPSQVLLLVR